MLSILIPQYNYDVLPLVTALIHQGEQLDIPFEIRVLNDASTEAQAGTEALKKLPLVRYSEADSNQGRTATRQRLAQEAEFDTLLFLDADVLPGAPSFLKNYAEHLLDTWDVVFGGVAYQEDPPDDSHYLRWKYGSQREAKTVKEREQNPYYIISQNILIKKAVFLDVNQQLENRYGMDLVFSYRLEQRKAKIIHIDNPVYHLGLEPNEVFLDKALSAVENLVQLEKDGAIADDFTSLQKTYRKLKSSFGLGWIDKLVSSNEKSIRKNLNSNKARMVLFDLYRLSHYIRLKS